jgi:hypothetical protein
MKRNLFVALMLSLTLFSCRPKVIYVDRPVTQPTNTNTPAPATDNQVYQAPASDYTSSPQNTNTSNTSSQQQYNNDQTQDQNQLQPANNQPVYRDQPEPEQQYYTNQQRVNYASSSYQTFYDELSPYGSWINYPGYGYVWAPAQGPEFTPYATGGHWVYTQYGWTWASDYSWGWAPFHYGRWTMDPSYGWLWIPGNTWAPAWVTWGHCNGYYGWAPIGPNVYSYEGYRPPVHYWNFVPENHITEYNVNNYVVNHEVNNTIVNHNTTNITIINNNNTYNNITYCAGPTAGNVETVTGHKIQTVTVSETPKPLPGNKAISNNNLAIYRPAISQTTAQKAAPARIVAVENVKTVNSTAIHGVLPRQNNPSVPVNRKPDNLEVNPALRTNTNQPHPANNLPENNKQEPMQNRPVQTQPVQERPMQTQPVQERPMQTQPNQNRPMQEQPIQNRPVQTQPVQERPIQTQPIQNRPIQTQPVQRPAQELPRSEPVRKPEPVVRNPNQNRPPANKPKLMPRPAPVIRPAPPKEEKR